MDFGRACVPELDAPLCNAVGKKAGSASPRNVSLTGKRNFDRVYRQGNRVHVAAAGIVAIESPTREDEHAGGMDDAGTPARAPSRLAFVAGRSVGNAVVRNRAKRRLREAVRMAQVPDGWDLVISARAGTATEPFDQLVKQLQEGIARATSGKR